MHSPTAADAPRGDASNAFGPVSSPRLLYRSQEWTPDSASGPRYRFSFSPTPPDTTASSSSALADPASPRHHRTSFSYPDHVAVAAGPRSPGASGGSGEEDFAPPSPSASNLHHRRKSIPVRSVAAAPADEKSRAQEGIVMLDVFSRLRENPGDLLYDRDQKKREIEYQMRMDLTFNPVLPAANGPSIVPGSAPNSVPHSPTRSAPPTPYIYSSSAPTSPSAFRRVRTMDERYLPHHINTSSTSRMEADFYNRGRDRADSAPLPRYNGSAPRRRQSYSHGSPRSPPRGGSNEDSSESLSSESSSSGSPSASRPPSAPRKRKENATDASGPPKRRGRKPNVSRLVRDFLPNHTKVLNGVDQLSTNISDFQKLKSNATATAGAPMVTWKGHPLPVDPNQEGYDLLTEEEKQICSILRLLPVQYLAIKDALLSAYEQRKQPFKKREAQKMCRVDVNKTAKVYDWFRFLNWLPQDVFGRVEEDEL